MVGKSIGQSFPETPAEQLAEYEAAPKGQTVKTRRTFASPTSGADQFATVLTPWYVADRKVGGITVVVGWSEIATTKRATPAAVLLEDFDGSLLDMLKNVS